MAVEIGWLIDNGTLCIGYRCGGLALVTYTDPTAIRFSRSEDAQHAIYALHHEQILVADKFKPVEHGWG